MIIDKILQIVTLVIWIGLGIYHLNQKRPISKLEYGLTWSLLIFYLFMELFR